MQLENNTLYYIYDPMCSWCYAFESVLCLLQEQLPIDILDKPVLGGLATDSNIPMPIETQTMVRQAWHKIENTVKNVKFNFDFWRQNTPYRSTYPACRAVLAAESQSSELGSLMRKKIQHAYYQDAKNPSLNNILIDCARELGLDVKQFSSDLINPAINEKLIEHIMFSRKLGVSTYPSLRLILINKIYTIPIDYNDVSPILNSIKKNINQ
ncbi:MAG: DsbA family protein [Methylococcales bacterium]|nr:DsbA family protein [Methylococcales bacterium]